MTREHSCCCVRQSRKHKMPWSFIAALGMAVVLAAAVMNDHGSHRIPVRSGLSRATLFDVLFESRDAPEQTSRPGKVVFSEHLC